MSKTDKTRPWAVRALDRPYYLVEAHDHRDRACDLPARPTGPDGVYACPGDGCRWAANPQFWALPEMRCGCAYCTDRPGRRRASRRERQAMRRVLRAYRAGDDV